jgi:8-oxo-dGTP diphosphatase
MSMPLKWEFPGGKLEKGEEPEECLAREIREELGLEIAVLHRLAAKVHRYESWTIELIPFVCRISGGVLHLHEHRAATWSAPEELFRLDWPAADIPVLHEYLAYLESRQ